MSPSENTTSTALDNSDPFLASPEANETTSSVRATATPSSIATLTPGLSLASLESGSVIPASVMEFFPIKYQRQNKNDNTNPIPDNQSLQILLKETLGGSCRQSALVNLLHLTEPLPPIIEGQGQGQGCEATTASASGCYDCNMSTPVPSSTCCGEPPKVFNWSTASIPATFGSLFLPVSFENSPKLNKRASMDHDMGNFNKLFPTTTHNNSNNALSAVSPASLAHINPLASAGLGTLMKPMPMLFGSIDPTFPREWNPSLSSSTSMDEDLSGNNNNNINQHDGCTECQLEHQHDQLNQHPQMQLSIIPRSDFFTQQLALPSTTNNANTTRSLLSKKTGKKEDKEYIDLTTYLNMPQSEAARRLGIPTSSLSKKWKEAAFDRKWPYRTVCKIDKEIMALLHNTSGPLPPDVEQNLGLLVRKRQDELRPVIIRK